MATLQDLRKYLGNYGGMNDTYDAETSDRLQKTERSRIANETIKMLCRTYGISALETTATLSAVAGTQAYAQPTGAISYYRIWRLDGTEEKVLKAYRNKQDFDDDYPAGTTQGEPEAWVIWGNQIVLGPTPGASYTYTIDYVGRLVDLFSIVNPQTTEINVLTDTITATGHGYSDGLAVLYSNGGGTSATGLTDGVTYYVRDATANTFRVSATLGGGAVNISGTGNNAQTFEPSSGTSNYFTENEPMLVVYKALGLFGASYGCEQNRIGEWRDIAEALENNFAVRVPKLLGSASRPVSEEP